MGALSPGWGQRGGRACRCFSTGPTQLLRKVAPTDWWDGGLDGPSWRERSPTAVVYLFIHVHLHSSSSPTALRLVPDAGILTGPVSCHTRAHTQLKHLRDSLWLLGKRLLRPCRACPAHCHAQFSPSLLPSRSGLPSVLPPSRIFHPSQGLCT